ncbi:hypothetical protein [Blastococcus sp. TF02A-26]|uniref:hypothetical protein n=1 Tax=Blastococcus sp. TF02A-26 TaxID=2250577 RepID=UPI000DE939F1|nr:hypothetical protein [Blastococcus sp. TF02A-26]RBY87504.1 hypothetical protein DQ240_07965 [Blastococcus sp. TF02A-26]
MPSGPLTECLTGLTEGDPTQCLPPAPQQLPTPPAPTAETPAAEQQQQQTVPEEDGPTADAADVVPTDEQGQETPDPVAELCAALEDGMGELPVELAPLTGPLAGVVATLCANAEEVTEELEALLGELETLVTDLLAVLTDPKAGCETLVGLIEKGGAALGLPAEVLTGLIEQFCSFIPGEEPAPQPQPQPQPQPAQPVVHPQPQQQHQPAVVPVAHTGGTGGGQLAYTGTEPAPYLAGGLIALGLGTGLTLLGRRRASSDA